MTYTPTFRPYDLVPNAKATRRMDFMQTCLQFYDEVNFLSVLFVGTSNGGVGNVGYVAAKFT